MKLGVARTLRAQNLILIFLALLVAMSVCPTAEASAEERVLTSVDYLDYTLASPHALYADEEVIMVAQEANTVYFYDGKIYEMDVVTAQRQIYRNGDRLYYTRRSMLYSVEIGVFEETAVLDGNGQQIVANSFAIKGDRLIALTNTGATFYKSFNEVAPTYTFDDEVASILVAGNVHITDDGDYYYVNGEIFKDGEFVCFSKAENLTDVNGKLYFSNKAGIYALEGSGTEVIYQSGADDGGVLGLSEYKGDLLFICGSDNEIKQMSADGSNLRKFLFEVTVETDAEVAYTPTPVTVRVTKGTRLHRGVLIGGAFEYDFTDLANADEDYVKLGEISTYSVLYGMNGYALCSTALLSEIVQNIEISFEKGYLLYDCSAYVTCVADESMRSFALKKGDVVTVKDCLVMDGIEYALVENSAGDKGFVLAGEIKPSLHPTLPENTTTETTATSKDNSLYALIIILLSAGVLSLALFVILTKKEYIKL